MSTVSNPQDLIEYPDCDGQPMSDNTLQFQWITTIQGNVDGMVAHDPNVFVAGDLLWYPVQGRADLRSAPDTLVVFGRSKGYRGSYKQWVEGGIAPQVTFEILSPGNRPHELDYKFFFYERYGVEEYYQYDPFEHELLGWLRQGGKLEPIIPMHGWISPRLGIRFDMSGDELVIYRPDGQRFLTFVELMEQQRQTEQQAELERLAREQAQQRAEQERLARERADQHAEQERLGREEAERRAKALADKLRSLGIDPDQ